MSTLVYYEQGAFGYLYFLIFLFFIFSFFWPRVLYFRDHLLGYSLFIGLVLPLAPLTRRVPGTKEVSCEDVCVSRVSTHRTWNMSLVSCSQINSDCLPLLTIRSTRPITREESPNVRSYCTFSDTIHLFVTLSFLCLFVFSFIEVLIKHSLGSRLVVNLSIFEIGTDLLTVRRRTCIHSV